MALPLVVVAKGNAASENIRDCILASVPMDELGRGEWGCGEFLMAEYEGSIVEIAPVHDAEYYIYASTHRSESGTPCLAAHTPGNWGAAEMGGEPRTLNFSHPGKLKEIAVALSSGAKRRGWQFSIEVDHHGPSVEKPVVFAEIGSGEAQWGVKEAGAIVAGAIVGAIRSDARYPCHIGFGGTHYAPKFTPKVVSGDVAFGHIVSGYALERFGVDEEMVGQAIGKNVGRAELAEIDWKGVRGETRRKLTAALDSLGMKWVRA